MTARKTHNTQHAVVRESVLHMLYEQDQWLERYAGYGRVDPDYSKGGDTTDAGGSTSE